MFYCPFSTMAVVFKPSLQDSPWRVALACLLTYFSSFPFRWKTTSFAVCIQIDIATTETSNNPSKQRKHLMEQL